MVVISSLCVLALCLPHIQLYAWLSSPPRTLSLSWETMEPIQTPTRLNTKHHSIIEIIKKALVLKIQTRGKLRISGACWNVPPESLDSTDMLYLIELANSGEGHSRKPWSHTVYSWTTHCSKGLPPSFPFHVTQSLWQIAQRWASEGKGCWERGSFCKHLPQPLKF